MTTQYTTILKLALPVEGELSGTWGDVVNDNITQMIEQAVAGKAVVNTWSGNSHTLTTADGTTSESRCAILELTDTNTQLSGVGNVVCPTNTKLYIVDNNTARVITVKTSSGSGVAVPVGKTMLVYCDGTNVVEGVTHANSLSLGTSTSTVNAIATATDLGAAGSSNSNLPTQLAVKTYVDAQVDTADTLAEILAIGNTTGSTDIEVTAAQKVQFRDAAIYINSSVDGQLDIVADGEVQIATALVDINGNLDVSGTTNISGSTSFTKNAIASVAISGVARSSNTVTVTTSAVHGLSVNDLVNLNGVTDTSFNGYFTVTAISSTTVFTFSQTAANASSSGGSTTEIVYNLNASGTALNQMNGPLNITANSPIDGLEITQSGSGNGLHVTGTTDLVGNTTLTGNLDVSGTALVTGVLTTTAATVFNGGFASNADSTLGTDKKVQFRDAAIYINSSADGQLDIVADTEIQIAATTVDLNGNLDVSGTIAVGSTLSSGDITIAVDDTPTLNFKKASTADVLASINVTTDAGSGGKLVIQTKRNGNTPVDRLTIDDDGAATFSSTVTSTSFVSTAGGTFTTASGNDLNIVYPEGRSLFFKEAGTTTLALDNAQGATFAGTIASSGLVVSANTNGDPVLAHLYNTSTGTSAEATVYITNSATASSGLFLQTTGSSFTTAGGFVQDAAVLGAGSAASGGLSIMTRANADMRFYTNGHTNERMRILAAGNVGIGTGTPGYPLNLFGAETGEGTAVGQLGIQSTTAFGSSPQAGITFTNNHTASSQAIMGAIRVGKDNTTSGNYSGFMAFDTRTNGVVSAERMRIDSSGNVGINNSNPSAFNSLGGKSLVIGNGASTSNLTLFSDDTGGNGYGHVAFADTNVSGSTSQYSGLIQYYHGDNSMRFYTNTTEKMRIDASGNVGIGTIPNSGGHSSWANLSMGTKGSLISSTAAGGIYGMLVTDNLYIPQSTGSFAYRTTDEASYYKQDAGYHLWYNAPSGSAGAAATLVERMQLNASGNLGVGVAPSVWRSYEASIDIGRSSLSTSVGNYSTVGSLLAYNTFINTDGQFTRKATGFSTTYNTVNGVHDWTSDASAGVGAFTPTPRMTLDASGRVTMPYQPAFSVTVNSAQNNLAINTDVVVVWGAETFDVGANFSASEFTAPVTGKYQLNLMLRLDSIDSAANYYIVSFFTSNRNYRFIYDPGGFSGDLGYWSTNLSVLADMDASDTVYITVNQAAGTAQTDVVNETSYQRFSGILVA
jgi:hypothetical protein